MTLDEAIQIYKDIEPAKFYYFLDNEKQAIKLLIEAGKREQYHRTCYPNQNSTLLPGETKD